ncbi:serpentine type 7TM GPCR chemoreceptor srt domain-containing protein [Ditylenchus destructor]|nr:serpentine type 7TM GPCR chemoreceptor srt domain-containing protein [Ditylenchus destructor]
MEMYIFRPDDYERLYSCDSINIDDVPLAQRQHIAEGIITIVLCAIYYILYIPCIISMYKHLDVPCYRLLFYMSLSDCSILWMLGFLHGIFGIMGVMFCSYPKLIYISGAAISGLWISESVTELSLSINRCLAILSPKYERILFDGWRMIVWISLSAGYGIWWAFFIKPVLFNGIHFTWFFNPYVGYRNDVAENMFLQVFIISMFNLVACSVYSYMMYAIPYEFFIHFGQFCWLHIHGFPPVIYLLLNKTIRDDTKRLINKVLQKYPKLTAIKEVFTLTTPISNATSDQNNHSHTSSRL